VFRKIAKRSALASLDDAPRERRPARQFSLRRLLLGAVQLIRGSSRTKFIAVIVSLEIAVMSAVLVVVERYQRSALLEQAELRALALATGLAGLSEGYLFSYNFAKLEQAAENLADNNEDIAYSVVHLRDGKVAAFSGRSDLQGRLLDDAISQRALEASKALVQHILIPQTREPGYDVAIPVYAPRSSQKWGTVRIGFSLKRAYVRMQETSRALLLVSVVAVLCGSGLAIVLATRISKPIGQLVTEVEEITRGSYDHPIRVHARDEIGYLARAFEQMRLSLQEHLAGLAEEKRLLEETNARLLDTQRQLLHLSARVAHEVNNPLAIIKTAIRIIRKQDTGNDTTSESLAMIEEEIDRIARIIREILAFSRPTHSNQLTEINAVILSLESLLQQSLHEKQIVLRLVLEPDLPSVRVSPDHLKQVILNGVRNAEDAMPGGGQLLIQTTHTDTSVEFSITDTGCGIPEEYMNRLFDPFFTTKDKEVERGMGLGLAVSYGIVRGANGNITIESEVGKGTTLRASLPIAKA